MRRRLAAALLALTVVAAALVGAGLWLGGELVSGTPQAASGPESAEEPPSAADEADADAELFHVALQAIRVLNTKDLALAKRLACDPVSEKQEDLDKIPPGVSFALTGEPVIMGDHATVPYRATDRGSGKTHDGTLTFRRVGSRWCGESST